MLELKHFDQFLAPYLYSDLRQVILSYLEIKVIDYLENGTQLLNRHQTSAWDMNSSLRKFESVYCPLGIDLVNSVEARDAFFNGSLEIYYFRDLGKHQYTQFDEFEYIGSICVSKPETLNNNKWYYFHLRSRWGAEGPAGLKLYMTNYLYYLVKIALASDTRTLFLKEQECENFQVKKSDLLL